MTANELANYVDAREMNKYSDIVSDGGFDPRNEYEAKRKPVELADELEDLGKFFEDRLYTKAAAMLRQQQAEIEKLKSGISYIQGKAESQRIWDGNKWHWNLPYPIKSIFDKCGELLK